MKYLIALISIGTSAAFGRIDWKPEFDDEPLSNEQIELIAEAVPNKPITEPKKSRKALLYSATAGARHGSIPVGQHALKKMAESSGAYELVVSDDPVHFERDNLKQFDAVILLNSTGNFFMPNTRGETSLRDQFSDDEWAELEKRDAKLIGNLIDYVRNGGGLVGIHAATDAYYGNWDFRNMIGGTFWGHPWTAGQQVMIEIEDSEHELMNPVFGDTKQLSLKEEIYQFNKPYSRERLRVLLRLNPELSETPQSEPRRKDGDFAVAWARSEEKGRVFYTSIGHRHEHFWNPLILKHYLAGIQFATGDLEADMTPSSELEQ